MAAVRWPRDGGLVLALSLLTLACRIESELGGRWGVVGSPAPEFTLPDLLGNTVSLADHRGQPLVVDFWATWCAPCVRQIPVLNAFQATHYGEVGVLGIAVDVQGIEVVAPFAVEHDIQYPVLVGDEFLAERYGAFGFPTLFVIAPDGTIAAKHVGIITEEELEEIVATVLARSGPPR